MIPRPLQRLWSAAVVEISLPQVILVAAVLLGADTVYDRLGDSLGAGVFDELAHIATALLVLNVAPRRWRDPILLPALLASFLIDLDHVPQYLLGTRVLTEGTPRPYTHSLLSVAVVLALALVWRRRRTVWLGIAVGLVLHFLRDLAEGSGAGVSLLWPLTDHGFAYRHRTYLALMAGVVVINLVMLALASRRGRRLVLAAMAVIGLGGCGAGHAGPAHSATTTGTARPAGAPAAGRSAAVALFHRDCQVCHSISGPDRRTQQGGELAGLTLPRAEISQFTAEMPQLHGPLSAAQVRTLTGLIMSLER